MGDVLLIVPCYNEADRLDIEAFKSYTDKYYFLFVNDGSSDKTAELLAQHTSDRIFFLDLKQNQGKGEAVRQGFIHSNSLPVYNQLEWIGFWDADLATPLFEVENFFRYQQLFYPKAEVLLGSRLKRLGSKVSRSGKRHYLGRFFATVVDNLFHIGCYDTQCGAKLFRKELVPVFTAEPYISKWAFDVEVLVRLKGKNIIEYPLMQWEDVAGSKIKVSKIAFRILRDLRAMHKKYN